MAKAVTHATETVRQPLFGMNKAVRRIACDDGTTYVFERPLESPRYTAVARYDRDGSRAASPSRLPACVEAHMDGVTLSGPFGEEAKAYWDT